TGQKLREFSLQLPFTNVIAFTPDSKALLTGIDHAESKNQHLAAALWDVGTGSLVRRLEGPFPNRVLAENLAKNFAFSPDGKFLPMISLRGPGVPLALYDAESWEIVATFSIERDSPVALAFSPDSRTLSVGTILGRIVSFDVQSHRQLNTFLAY